MFYALCQGNLNAVLIGSEDKFTVSSYFFRLPVKVRVTLTLFIIDFGKPPEKVPISMLEE